MARSNVIELSVGGYAVYLCPNAVANLIAVQIGSTPFVYDSVSAVRTGPELPKDVRERIADAVQEVLLFHHRS